jgi:hypothetical protein
VGFVEVSTSALLSTARQRVGVGQVTPVIWTEPAAFVPAKGAPPVGSSEVRRLPPPSPATQSSEATQETPCRSRAVGAFPSRQAEAPPVGAVEVKIRPSFPTATQMVGVAQEMPRRSGEPGRLADYHYPVAGSVEVKTLPAAAP